MPIIFPGMQSPILALTLAVVEHTADGFRAWMSDYIPLFGMDVITYQCVNHDTGLANLC